MSSQPAKREPPSQLSAPSTARQPIGRSREKSMYWVLIALAVGTLLLAVLAWYRLLTS